MKTVLITAIGSFSADIVIKKCRENGMRVIGCDIYPREWVVDAGNVDAFYQVPRATEAEAYPEALLEICSREKVDGILPLTDVEVTCSAGCAGNLRAGESRCAFQRTPASGFAGIK